MPLIPALCRNCGLAFESNAIEFLGGHLTMEGNRTNCPQCGAWANLLEGTFTTTQAVSSPGSGAVSGSGRPRLEMLSGPAWSREVFDNLYAVLSAAAESDADDPILEVVKGNTWLGGKLLRHTQGWSRGDKLQLIGLLLAIVTLFLSGGDIDIDVDLHIGDDVTIESGITDDQMSQIVRDIAEAVDAGRDPEPGRTTP